MTLYQCCKNGPAQLNKAVRANNYIYKKKNKKTQNKKKEHLNDISS